MDIESQLVRRKRSYPFLERRCMSIPVRLTEGVAYERAVGHIQPTAALIWSTGRRIAR